MGVSENDDYDSSSDYDDDDDDEDDDYDRNVSTVGQVQCLSDSAPLHWLVLNGMKWQGGAV